jgi:hypothetical protein
MIFNDIRGYFTVSQMSIQNRKFFRSKINHDQIHIRQLKMNFEA